MRDSFHSRIGFILAAAGSAVGLGNIWGFPTQVANHGGGAFLLVYLCVIFILAIPALYSELLIGHSAQANPVKSLTLLSGGKARPVGRLMGYLNVLGSCLMLSFYHVVAGWMVVHALGFLAKGVGLTSVSEFLLNSSMPRDLIFTGLFLTATALVVFQGVEKGIERWSKRLMPTLVVLLVGLIIYMLTLPGASVGLERYLIPDFTQITNTSILVAAMGQAFFSLSIGLGGMMIYGSYLKPGAKLGRLSLSVAALDTFIAFLAGLLIIPALYAGIHLGVSVGEGTELVGEGQLIFAVLPELFNSMGVAGPFVAFAFFSLLSIAALTSTIAQAEVPVSYCIEERKLSRPVATAASLALIGVFSLLLILFFEPLFGWVVTAVTQFQLPLSGLFYLLVVGWLWRRSNHLKEIAAGSFGLTLLRWHIRYLCPVLMSIVFYHVALS
ncbi:MULTISPECIES: sodium-dependent transporter [Idiomarina]|jgi:NSS family neurotransmitter:Na+ symporter|uniref:Transporter n=1 Tax=Idiomarina zobellii TaxID=86103 RepID=A0A837NGR9_9GAMM|nr:MULTISPECIES: sodium-dependent transporter [Idiomarina]KTG28932.1 transporter [Idiomarina sp. H105]MBF38951.1 sodium-dependent transporter [Idiomarinaceae bacterium]OAF09697.1 transporter [Idiomarina sp. WRN-38]KPD24328.1 transporter [Idiomarina zobellii]WPZ01607.1 sodium-dependent transporter [Idiomarina sp. OXR-189]|tara:strand:- start:23930 stop:25249 length:1320 start_codon:yes stop_codon:yes gene_type:complete